MKKIALIGNMNNNFFALCRHLRDRGYHAELFFRHTHDHFHPKADTTSLDDLKLCHEIDWFEYSSIGERNAKIASDLKSFDFFIGSGMEAAYAHAAGIHIDIYAPYGSDIYKYAHLPHEFSWHVKLRSYLGFSRVPARETVSQGTHAKLLHSAIKNADHIVWDHANPQVDQHLFAIEPQGRIHRIPVPFLYTPYFHKAIQNEFQDFHWAGEIAKLRQRYEFIVLYHGRQEWKKALYYRNNSFTAKNTHHLIHGFSEFIKRNRSADAALVMLEYGGDVFNSKVLVEQLGITDHVIWIPSLYRKDIFNLISNVDICCGQFGKSYITFGTIMESMILGKPVLHHRDDSLYLNQYERLYPLYNCRTSKEIAECIERAFTNPTERRQIGREAQDWVREYAIERPLNAIVKIIESAPDPVEHSASVQVLSNSV